VPTDPDLAGIRTTVLEAGIINFLQLSGTPGLVSPTGLPNTTMDNGLFVLNGTPTTGGNWYPLPANADFPALGHAFGTLPAALGTSTKTIYAFWQEPSHTISESLSATTSIAKYTNFYSQVSREIAQQCSTGRCPVAGAQLNSNDGDQTPADGHRYKLFMDGLRGNRAAEPAVSMPLDYFTIQNYSAQWNDNIFDNARLALGTDSMWTPVLMNEWDYCVNSRAGDGCGNDVNKFTERYDGQASWKALHWLLDTVERPDLSHVLLREKVLQDRDPATGAYSYPWTQIPILFMDSMSELRRPVSLVDPELRIVASGDGDHVTIIGWNEGATDKPMELSLVNLPASLRGSTLFEKKISKAIRDVRCPGSADVMDATNAITCWDDAIAPVVLDPSSVNLPELVIAPGEFVMVFAGSPPPARSSTFTDHYVRSVARVDRNGTAAPKAMAHFDPHTGSITVGVRKGGVGIGRVVLEGVPDTLPLTTRVAAQGELRADATVAGIRVDYLDASHARSKTVLFRDSRWPTAPASPASTLDWPATDVEEVVTDLCGQSCRAGEGGVIVLDLASHAPAGWSATRFIDLGVVLAGSDGDAIYRVDLP